MDIRQFINKITKYNGQIVFLNSLEYNKKHINPTKIKYRLNLKLFNDPWKADSATI